MNKTVEPKTLSGGLRVLPSKSASHRAVMMAAMAEGKTQLEPLQLSKDISATLACAQALGLTRGAAIAESETEGFVRSEIWGGGEGAKRALRELDCGESGSTLRFFIPLALDGRGAVRFEGRGRLMQRPLSVYEDMFKARGILWRHEGDSLTVDGLLESGRYSMPGDVSSQFITGMLLALPRLTGDSVLEITMPLESRAYVELTRRIQAHYHVVSEWDEKGQSLLIPGGQRVVSPSTMHIGGDWSHAAFYLVAGAIGRGEIRLTGLDPQSAQGDRAVVEILRDMGADITESNFRDDAEPVCDLTVRHSRLHGTEIGGAIIPRLIDELPVIAVAAAFAEGETVIRDAQELKVKESNRIAAMVAELTKAGVDVEETDDGMIVRGGAKPHGAAFETYKDHRIAMSLAVLGLAAEGASRIDEPEVVAISYPDFFATLEKLGG